MVGFRFHTAAGQEVKQYYLVATAEDGESATEIAGCIANSTAEAVRRGEAVLDHQWVEVRRVRRSPLGCWRLAEPAA